MATRPRYDQLSAEAECQWPCTNGLPGTSWTKGNTSVGGCGSVPHGPAQPARSGASIVKASAESGGLSKDNTSQVTKESCSPRSPQIAKGWQSDCFHTLYFVDTGTRVRLDSRGLEPEWQREWLLSEGSVAGWWGPGSTGNRARLMVVRPAGSCGVGRLSPAIGAGELHVCDLDAACPSRGWLEHTVMRIISTTLVPAGAKRGDAE
jgi:hypothetical protein